MLSIMTRMKIRSMMRMPEKLKIFLILLIEEPQGNIVKNEY